MRHEHAKWSDSTFGCVGPIGPLKHLSKEALEAAAEPDDLSEWADMQFLLWDAQRRAGISDAEITAAMEDKLKINMERQWPEPKDGEPRLHIKEPGNSPVIPDGLSTVCAEAYQVVGVMADALGVFGDAAVQKVLDNLSQQKLVHRDVLPFSLPVTPDGWISCSERMPVIGELNWRTSFPLLVTCEIGVIPAYYGFVSVNGDRHYGFMESLKYGDDNGNHPQTNEYGLISNVTHWMPLPERRRSRTVNNAELFQKISALATECHAIASELDVGDERTEMFEIYSVLRNLCRRGYATQVGRMTNPLLSFCDEDDE
ncbi:dATP/dGTP pyrophosphohydrolase domain-containing protein [Escherichia coli]|uniref:dATP/dGTP pyrophosphohydrolase domain-containing protein n=1 Tax=Escherichia coli TaxID=562 RepID=UPI0025A1ECB1|nr:dATP/dGTP pyrophosphohydrolase domain-containing protein [Escherichia coli]